MPAGTVAEQPISTSPPIDEPARRPKSAPWDIVDEWGFQSFPASDPPANW